MPLLNALPLVGLVYLAGPQQLKQSDWRPSKVTPLEFAKKLDNGILSIKDAEGRAKYICEFFDGESKGEANFHNKIRNNKTFRVEFIRIQEKSLNDPFTRQDLYGKNGAFHLFTTGKGYQPVKSGSSLGVIPAKTTLVQAWPQHFQQLLFQPFVTRKGIFQPLVQGMLKGDGGYSLDVRSRVMQGSTLRVPQIRLMAKRTKAAAKKMGDCTIEIVCDTVRWMPIQVRVSQTNLKGKKAYYEWVSDWAGPRKFKDTDFNIAKN